MKKIMVVLVVMAMFLFSFNVFAQAQSSWSVKAGIDFASEMDFDFPAEIEGPGEETYDTEMGYTLIGEYKMPYSNNINFGAGLAYQLDREVDFGEGDTGDFGFTPFYGLAEYRMEESPFYFVGHLGYASLSFDYTSEDGEVTDSSGGLYYALGGGMDLGESYEAELLYTQNSGTFEFSPSDSEGEESYDIDVDYAKFTVTFGMRF